MKRLKNKIKSRVTFFIVTNGESTEKNYFTALKSKRSQFEVTIKIKTVDPLDLVLYAKEFLDKANQVWVVFDVDNFHHENRLIPALREAEKSGIKCAISNISFEVWLISHFKKIMKPMTNKELNNELSMLINAKYVKTDERIIKKMLPNYKNALINAKIVYEQRVKQHRKEYGENSIIPIWEWVSCTTVYKLIEALKLRD